MAISNGPTGAAGDVQPRVPWWHVALGLVVFVVVLLGALWVLSRAVAWVLSLETDLGKAVVTGTVAVCGTILAQYWASVRSRRAQREQVVRDNKRALYGKFLSVVFSTFNMAEADGETEQQALLAKVIGELRDLTPELMVWASRDVIVAWNAFREAAAAELGPVAVMSAMAELVNVVREELGLGRCPPAELLSVFITDVDEYPELAQPPQET